MEYNIKAIPTTYKGINFRSRLEAKWAAFFDLCGWQWQYEPFDMDGWIPDFILHLGAEEFLVEVKPVIGSVKSGEEFDAVFQAEIGERNVASGSRSKVLIVGTSPFENWYPGDVAGVLYWYSDDKYPAGGRWAEGSVWANFVDILLCDNRNNPCLVPLSLAPTRKHLTAVRGQYPCPVCGRVCNDRMAYFDARPLWNRACNSTQWRARR